MQKKVIALAVAGALAAPAAVMAQSTVQVYGNLYGEYSFINQGTATNGTDRANPDVLQTPGSEIGFKGEEKLGGGLSAWFQCTSTADFRGAGPQGFCGRDSAVGFKGSFGNAFVGNWASPFRRAFSVGNVGARSTGVFGSWVLLYGAAATTLDGANPGSFARRQNNSINYDSPKFGGFQFMAQASSTNSGTNDLASAANAKPRTVSLGGTYTAGPLALAAGYEEHNKFYAAGGDEKGYHVSASYKLGAVKFGGVYTKQEWDDTAATNGEVSAWNLGVEWNIRGPHNLAFAYTAADDVDGTSGAIGTRRPAAGVDTGAKQWQVRYLHNLSKRTYVGVGYVSLKTDRNATYGLGGFGAAGTGADSKGLALNVGHRF